jgi:precorrin-3B methylase
MIMAYENKPRPYKKEYQQQKERGELDNRMERQRARRALDKKGVNRDGKDVAHVKALSKGGSNADGYALQSPHKNRSFKRNSDGSMK